MNLVLLPKQHQFIFSKKSKAAYVGGIGSGKSYALAVWLIIQSQKYPKAKGMLCANTYKQLQQATLQTVFFLLNQLSIPYKYNKVDGILIINNQSPIYCYSLEKYDNIRGVEVGYIGIDEAAFSCLEAYNVVLGRLRDINGPLEIKISTTPNGFNWLYDLCQQSQIQLITSSSTENKHLPEQYLNSIREQYDEKLLKQELEGLFINTTQGQVYYAFDRKRHIKEFQVSEVAVKRAGTDFNVNPITTVLGYQENGIIYIYDEIYLKDSNTYQLVNELNNRLSINSEVIPDSTGAARKTSSTKTDHQIIREGGYKIPYVSNPHVKDRYNCINGHLQHNRIVIHPRCKMLIKDLETLPYENKDPMLSHISDAMGYLIWYLAPLQQPQQKSRYL